MIQLKQVNQHFNDELSDKLSDKESISLRLYFSKLALLSKILFAKKCAMMLRSKISRIVFHNMTFAT